MHWINEVLRFPRVFLCVLALPASLQAQSVAFNLEDVEVVPGEEFSVLLTADISQPIRGFQLGVEFPQSALSFLGISVERTELARLKLETFDRSSGPGYGNFKAILPTGISIPAGPSVSLARLSFKISQGLDPGSLFQLALRSGLGLPPLAALVYSDTRTLPPSSLGSGQVKISDQNVLRIKDLSRLRLNEVRTVEFSAYNIEPLQGFSIGVKFDPSIFRFLEANVQGTITEAVGAEYVAPIIDNVNGTFILGVLLDYVPPFDHQLIPASGLELTIAKAKIQVIRVPTTTQVADLELADGLGVPPIRNLFVIDNLSYVPVKRNGQLDFLLEGEFVRGDSNSDGVVDISDPVATAWWHFLKVIDVPCEKAADTDDNGTVDIQDLVYTVKWLFFAGDPIPQPYPEAGRDPTQDDLPCPPPDVVNPQLGDIGR